MVQGWQLLLTEECNPNDASRILPYCSNVYLLLSADDLDHHQAIPLPLVMSESGSPLYHSEEEQVCVGKGEKVGLEKNERGRMMVVVKR